MVLDGMGHDGIERLKTTRRRYLQSSGGMVVGMGAVDKWEGSSIETVGTEQAHVGKNLTDFAPEVTPLDVTPETYVMRHGHRKRTAMLEVLSHPEVNNIVSNYYGSFDAFDDWLDHDAIGLNGCVNFTVEEGGRAGLESGAHTVHTKGNQFVRALVARENDELTHLSVTEPHSYTVKRRYGEAERRILEATLEKKPVQKLLGDKDEWYVGIGKVTSISSYSPKYQKAEITFPVFILPRGNEYIVVDTGIQVKNWPDDPQPGELVYAQPIYPKDAENVPENQYGVKAKGRVMEPPHYLAKEHASVNQNYPSVADLPDPPVEKIPWLFRGKGHYSPKVKASTPNPTERDNWKINWSDSSTDGMILSGEYKGTQVFERMALSVSLTAYPPHNGRYSDELFVGPRSRAAGNVMFHDNLGLTGPGVLGIQDLPPLDRDWAPSDRPKGFKYRTHYHTGAAAVPEFHSGLRYGPYNYVIDWHFFEDGQMASTYQRNGPGYETGHGMPVYASMWSFIPTPGGAEKSNVYWFDGDWKQVTDESRLISDGANMLRVKDPNGDDVLDFPLSQEDEVYVLRYHEDEMGVAPRIKDSHREKQFWHPIQYMDDESVANERVVVWVIQTTHGETVPYKSGSVPFVNMARFNVGTADREMGSTGTASNKTSQTPSETTENGSGDKANQMTTVNSPGMGVLSTLGAGAGIATWLKKRFDSDE